MTATATRWGMLAALLSLVGCFQAPVERTCIPGRSEACVGAAGCAGGQVCDAEGTSFGACSCGAPTGGGGGGGGVMDAGLRADAGVLDAGPLIIALGPTFALVPMNSGRRVYDFDLTSVGDHFLFASVGDNALSSRDISVAGSLGAQTQLAFVSTTYASSVSAARLAGVPSAAAVVGSGSTGLTAHQVEESGPSAQGPRVFTTMGQLPAYNAVAWNGDTALIAWTTYGTVSFRLLRRDGTVLGTTPQLLMFPGSTFVPRVAVASDGVDWLVALTATETLLFRVTAAGAVSVVGARGSSHAGQSLALEHGPRGYLLAFSSEVLLLSSGGEHHQRPHGAPRRAGRQHRGGRPRARRPPLPAAARTP